MRTIRRAVTRLALLLAAIACFSASAAVPANAEPPQETGPAIWLQAATFVPTAGEQPALAAELLAAEPSAGSGQYLVQFEGPILQDWRDALESAGATILNYVPDFAYRIEIDGGAVPELRRLPGVIWVGPYYAGYRLSPQLQSEAGGVSRLRVQLRAVPDAALLEQIEALGVRVAGQEGRILSVEADSSGLAALSYLPQVEWIEPLVLPRVQNDVATLKLQAPEAWTLGLSGQGQTVNIADTGLDTGRDLPQVTGDMHLDLDNRVDHLASWPISSLWTAYVNQPGADDGAADLNTGHGTHVAGSATGSGARSSGQYRGVAYSARLTFQALEQWVDWKDTYADGYHLVGVPADLNALYSQAYNWGARIHSNSWGTDEAGVYDQWAQQTDEFVWNHRDMTILYAAGNNARDANADGRVDYGSISAPATAKNIIAVGTIESYRPTRTETYGTFFGSSRFPAYPINTDAMANASSDGMMATSGRGPTADNRYAPQVVAPGTWIISTRPLNVASATGWGAINAYYMYYGGTSMSTPLVAGAVALVRQAYLARSHTPSAALLKATLIQSARDIPGQYTAPYGDAGPIPNNNEGWGAVDLESAVTLRRAWVDETTALATGQQTVLTYKAAASSQPARFTLVWTDYPGNPAVSKQLVNDLDLEIIAPDGKVYRGNVFSGGWSITGGTADRVNNVECVYLPTTQAGTYTVRVRGYNIPSGPQNFALLVDLPPLPVERQIVLPLVLRAYEPPAPVDLRDDFSTPNPAVWSVATSQDYSLGYVLGEYQVRLSPSKARIGSLPAFDPLTEMLIEVDARATNAQLQAYGLIFHYVNDSTPTYYAFVVSPNSPGSYAVFRVANDVWSAVIPWTTSSAIALGQNSNHLRVERDGQEATFWINGTQVGSLSSAELRGASRSGLAVLCWDQPDPTTFADVRFDNWYLRGLGASAGGAATGVQSWEGPLLLVPDGAETTVGRPE